MSLPPELERIVRELRSEEKVVREAAREHLSAFRKSSPNLDPAEGSQLLREAAIPFPDGKARGSDVSSDLLSLLEHRPRPEYVPVVIELFEKFSDNAKFWALQLVADLETRDAAIAFMHIVRQEIERGHTLKLPTASLERKPRHSDVFFPEILAWVEVPGLSEDVYRLALAYGEAGLLPRETFERHTDRLLRISTALRNHLLPAQKQAGHAWMWQEPYSDWRGQAELLLDLFAYFPAERVEGELREALSYRDTRLKYFAIRSLLRQGKPVQVRSVVEVASQPEMRNWLYNTLRESGRLSSFPEAYRNQAALAESDMVNWLTFPTELACVPDEIELMKVVSIETGLPDGVYDYYVFRFRTHEPHWAAKDGWMAGISGPFLRSDEPTTEALGETFSKFEKWETRAPEQHVGDLRELMKRWRDYHQKKGERSRAME